MRVRFGIVSVLVGVPVALAIGGGCGGSSSDNNSGGQDAAADISVADQSSPPDSSPLPVDSSVCAVDASLESFDAGNAALNDAGATTATCLACGKAACASEITACDLDCGCKTALVTFFSCIAAGADAGSGNAGCTTGILGNTNARTLGLCIYGACSKECGVPVPPKSDGGTTDAASDAASDAPADAPSDGG